MDVTAVNKLTGNYPDNNTIVIPLNNTISSVNENKTGVENELPWRFVHLSPESFIRYGYWRKFCDFFDTEDAAKDLNLNESGFSRFALIYLESKDEILKNYSGDTQKQHLRILEEAANNALEDESKSLSCSFDNFFNSSSYVYHDQLKKEPKVVFDKKVFTDRLLSVSQQILKIANNATNKFFNKPI